MKLNLTRPLVFFDLESTGLNTQTDRIIQYAFVKVHPDGSREQLCSLIDPEMLIPTCATEVTGITDAMVTDQPLFCDRAQQLLDFITGCDLSGFNLLVFDIALLYHEFQRAGIGWRHLEHHIIDAGNLFKIMETRTLEAAVRFYAGREHADSHDALGDTLATIDVLTGQLERYPTLPGTVEGLAVHTNYGRRRADVTGKFLVNEDGQYVINFGQNRGQLASDNHSFLHWMSSRDFPVDALDICHQVLNSPQPAAISINHDDDLPF